MRTGVESAIADVRAGRPVLVHSAGTPGGALVLAGGSATGESTAFAIRHTSGFLSAGVTAQLADRLDLPRMNGTVDGAGRPALTTVDGARGVGTGISAADRTTTLRLLADPRSRPHDLSRPGHMVLHLVDQGGVLVTPDVPEGAVDLAVLAGLEPVAATAALVGLVDPTGMATVAERSRFAATHGIVSVGVGEIAHHRRNHEQLVRPTTDGTVELRDGTFRTYGYAGVFDDTEYLVFTPLRPVQQPTRVQVHRKCRWGDALLREPCGCRVALRRQLQEVALGRAVLVYVQEPAPRGSLRTWLTTASTAPRADPVRHQLMDRAEEIAQVIRLHREATRPQQLANVV